LEGTRVKKNIFDAFGVNTSQEEAMEMDATLAREPKSGIFNGFDHMDKLNQGKSGTSAKKYESLT